MGSLNPFSTPKPQVTATSTNAAWFDKAGENLYNRANAASNKPYTPYTGQLVADRTANQLSASDISSNLIGKFGTQYFKPAQELIKNSVYSPNAVNARDVNANMVGTDRFNSASLNNYISPYVTAALDPTARKLTEASQKRANQIGQLAASRGAFGGSRQALLESENERNLNEGLSDLYATGLDKAFSQASNLFTLDEDRLLRAGVSNQDAGLRAALANQGKDVDLGKFNETARKDSAESSRLAGTALGNLGQQFNIVQDSNIDRLLKTGSSEQTTNQAGLDAAYKQFQEAQNYDKDQLSWLSNILSTSGGKGSIQNDVKPGENKAANAIGTAAQIASLFAAFSDVRLKKDIKKVGEKFGLSIYEFSYIGNEKRYRGVMAQEVKKVIPKAVCEVLGGYLMVDYSKINIPFELVEA